MEQRINVQSLCLPSRANSYAVKSLKLSLFLTFLNRYVRRHLLPVAVVEAGPVVEWWAWLWVWPRADGCAGGHVADKVLLLGLC